MADYTKIYDGAAKDTAESAISGADFDTEFDAIETAIATKANLKVPSTANTFALLDVNGNLGASELDDSYWIQATDLDTDNTLAADSDVKVVSQKAIKAYVASQMAIAAPVILDTPVTLVSSSSATGAWTQLDMSVAYAAAATAGATKAILRCYMSISATAAGSQSNGAMSIQKNGLGGVTTGNKIVLNLTAVTDTGETYLGAAMNTNDITVNLDANSDFEYYAAGGVTRFYQISLVGYYI